MNQRKSKYHILPVILNRWSARAMSDEMVSKEQLMTLFEAARWAPSLKEFFIPDEYTVEAMIAVGKPGTRDDLSEELQKREVLSDRQPIQDFVFEGIFKK